jgi:uncharacterized protein (DUF2267 family)
MENQGHVDDFGLKVMERRLAPGSNERLKMALPEKLRDLWTKITSSKPFIDGVSLNNYTQVKQQVYTDLRRVLF